MSTEEVIEDVIGTGELSEDELEGLSDEERAALEDEEVAEDSEQEEESEDDEAQEREEEPEPEPESPEPEALEEEKEEEPEAQEEQEAPAVADLMKAPGRDIGDVNSLEAKLLEIDSAIGELDVKVADGEIDLTDHIKQTRQLQDAKTSLMIEKANYQRNAQENQREIDRAWDSAIDAFYADPKNQRFDSPDNGGEAVVYEAMSGWLGRLQEQQPGRTPEWYLNQAKHDVLKAFGMPIEEETKPAKKRRKSALDNAGIPATLSEIPTAANNTVETEFSHLDKLDGMELEAAVAALTPAQVERWARQ